MSNPSSLDTKLRPLSDAELKQFFEDGFVIIQDLFTPDELQPLIKDTEKMVDDLANDLYATGRIKDKCEHLGFYQRLTALEAQFKGTNVLLHKRGLLPSSFAALWGSERMLQIAEQLLKTRDIAGHPVWNLRTKTPSNEQTTVPWHQDAGYLEANSASTMQATAWIPFIHATRETGCMQVVRGGHRKGICARHTCCVGNTWYIELPESEIVNTLGGKMPDDVVLCEVPFGGALLLNNLIPHRSLDNTSQNIRWSIDLRWQKTGEPDGFYGVKSPIELRRGADPSYKPNWEQWGATNRNEEFVKQVTDQTDDAFNPIISGPWMGRWEIVHQNAHTEQYLSQVKSGVATSTWHKA